MPAKTKTEDRTNKVNSKSKKKNSKQGISKLEPKFAGGWAGTGIKLTKSPRKLLKLFRDKSRLGKSKFSSSPLGWFVDRSQNDTLELLDRWYQQLVSASKLTAHSSTVIETVQNQLDSNSSSQDFNVDLSNALTALGACHSLRAMAGNCQFEDWNGLVTRLLELAQAAESEVNLAPPIYQLLAVEVPLTIAFQVPEIEDHRQLGFRASKKLAASISDMLDHDGWPRGTYLGQYGLLAASWVRCGLMIRKLELKVSGDVASQLEWIVRQAIRLLRSDGSLTFSSGDPRPIDDSLTFSLAKLTSDDDDLKILKLADVTQIKNQKTKLPKPSCVCEWGGAGILRSDWSNRSPRIGFKLQAYGGIETEISRSAKLIAGSTMPEISINGARAEPELAFEVVCEESDEHVEYVELETDLAGGVTLNRQMLLSRSEEFLLVADVVVPSVASRIAYRCQYPLAEGIDAMRESENCEIYLRSGAIQSLVLPLALPEWKVARSDDKLTIKDRNLVLEQSGEGFGLYAPLFFDLNPERSRMKRTWRQLTVAEDLAEVPRDVACAFRVQLDKQQWYFYRAIASKGNRTFFGSNFVGEFMFNRFHKSGKVTQMIVIE